MNRPKELFLLSFEYFSNVFRFSSVDFLDGNERTKRNRAFEFLETKLIQRRDFGTLN